MHWIESKYINVCDETKYFISIEFEKGEQEVRKAVLNYLRTKGLDSRSGTYETSAIEIGGLTLNLKNMLTAYLQGISDTTSSCEEQIRFWKRQLNSFYGLPAFGAEDIRVSELRQRTLHMEKKLDEKAVVINETVDKVYELQHKVDELEAYIKFLNPYYPLVIDDLGDMGDKKKKGWFKK